MYLYQRPRSSHYGAEIGSSVGAYIPTYEGLGQGGKEPLLEYLAFEGGGGKGVTYLGAVRALESHLILPIDIARRGQNQIKGISGASAGAISALLLAMGLNADQLSEILNRPEDFTAFFDDPEPGYSRSIDINGQPAKHYTKPSPATLVTTFTDFQWRILFSNLESWLGKSNPLVKQLSKHSATYIHNLRIEGGLFPGFAMRKFLAEVITTHLTKKVGRPVSGATLGFREFHELTGVDLRVTGTNKTSGKSMMFSRWCTPWLPVAEAVGISASLPLIFKPVHVKRLRNFKYNGDGWDGGLLNNLPLHAFDLDGRESCKEPPQTVPPLHPKMLALRLTDGPCKATATEAALKLLAGPGLSDALKELLKSVFGLSESGQIRTKQDRNQTIELRTYCLSTVDFGPSEAVKAAPIAEAEKQVNEYLVRLKNRR